MIDISSKGVSKRLAVAEGSIRMSKDGMDRVVRKNVEKGDVFESSKIAGMLAAKKASGLIPHCSDALIESVDVDFALSDDRITVKCEVIGDGKAGVEMQALVGCSIALLTIWDMVKPYERDKSGQYPDTMIDGIKVLKKTKEIEDTEKAGSPFAKKAMTI